MAACGSPHQIPDPKPAATSLMESLSPWDHIKSLRPVVHHHPSSFTEIFGELHFREAPDSSSSPTSLLDLIIPKEHPVGNGTSGSSAPIDSIPGFRGGPGMNSDSLQLCTEGLGFESSDDRVSDDGLVAHLAVNQHHPASPENRARSPRSLAAGEPRFPPPISCVGRSGKAGVSFRSFREDGRFVLKEIRVPTQEFLHAHRENGRLTLHFVQPDDEDGFLTEAQEDDNDDEDGGGNESNP